MDYIRQLNAFSNLSAGILSSNEVNVYLRLFWWNNRCCWTEWFETTDSRLQIETGIVSPNTIRAIRNSLRQKGFIDFIPGKRRSPTKYKIIDLSQESERLPSSFMSTIDIKTDIKTDINTDINADIKTDIKTDSIYKHKNNKTKKQAAAAACACAREENTGESALAEVVRVFEDNIHPLSGGIENDKLIDLVDDYSAPWVIAAVEEAVLGNGRSLRYITAVLERWKREGFKSPRKGVRQHGTGRNDSREALEERYPDFAEADRDHVYPWEIQPDSGGGRAASG